MALSAHRSQMSTSHSSEGSAVIPVSSRILRPEDSAPIRRVSYAIWDKKRSSFTIYSFQPQSSSLQVLVFCLDLLPVLDYLTVLIYPSDQRPLLVYLWARSRQCDASDSPQFWAISHSTSLTSLARICPTVSFFCA